MLADNRQPTHTRPTDLQLGAASGKRAAADVADALGGRRAAARRRERNEPRAALAERDERLVADARQRGQVDRLEPSTSLGERGEALVRHEAVGLSLSL